MNQKIDFLAILTKTGRPVFSKCLQSDNTFCEILNVNNEVKGNFISALSAISSLKSSNEKLRMIKLINNDFLFSTTDDKEYYFVLIMEKDCYNNDSKRKITGFLLSLINEFNAKRMNELSKINWKEITDKNMIEISNIIEEILTKSSLSGIESHKDNCKLDLSKSMEARRGRYWDTLRTIYP